jgi:hypothetical protein
MSTHIENIDITPVPVAAELWKDIWKNFDRLACNVEQNRDIQECRILAAIEVCQNDECIPWYQMDFLGVIRDGLNMTQVS